MLQIHTHVSMSFFHGQDQLLARCIFPQPLYSAFFGHWHSGRWLSTPELISAWLFQVVAMTDST